MSKRQRGEDEEGSGGGGGGVNAQDSSSSGFGGGDQRQGLISVNNLNYILEPDLSIAVNATYKVQHFDQQTYKGGDNALCAFNTGADYIDTRRSYLHFQVTPTNAMKLDGNEGCALNFINSIVISSRSGDELCRIRDLNRLGATVHRYTKSKEWIETVGAMYGYTRTPAQTTYVNPDTTLTAGTTYQYVIPLYMLCDFFAYGRLMPSMLMSGLRVEIHFEDGKKVDVSVPAKDTVKGSLPYTVSNCFFNLKSVQLTDATQRALNELSAVNGLEIVYSDWETTNQITNSDQIYCEVRRACSRALKAFCRLHAHKERSVKNADRALTNNIFKSVDWPVEQYQWQLGSLYFPQQPVKATDTTTLTTVAKTGYLQPYFMTLEAFDKIDPDADGTPAVTPKEFVSNYHTIGVNLERSSLFSLSGVPINNSRILSFHASCASKGGGDDTSGGAVGTSIFGFPYGEVSIYLKYVKLARVFLNNVEVEQ